jgi:hypothetical protein
MGFLKSHFVTGKKKKAEGGGGGVLGITFWATYMLVLEKRPHDLFLFSWMFINYNW